MTDPSETATVYLSGAIASLGVHGARALFANAEQTLQTLHPHWTIVNPFDVMACRNNSCNGEQLVSPSDYLHSWACYLRFDLVEMLQCDLVVALANWNQSPGARFEVFVAGQCGLPVKQIIEVI